MEGNMALADAWRDFCKRGKRSLRDQIKSVERCLGEDGIVRGFYSDFPLDPALPYMRSMYPSHDHITYPPNHSEMVLEARIVNDMKSHLTESEFWRLIEHLYAVGVAKNKNHNWANRPQRLPDEWSPVRHFG